VHRGSGKYLDVPSSMVRVLVYCLDLLELELLGLLVTCCSESGLHSHGITSFGLCQVDLSLYFCEYLECSVAGYRITDNAEIMRKVEGFNGQL
jgi:hypothetical protein